MEKLVNFIRSDIVSLCVVEIHKNWNSSKLTGALHLQGSLLVGNAPTEPIGLSHSNLPQCFQYFLWKSTQVLPVQRGRNPQSQGWGPMNSFLLQVMPVHSASRSKILKFFVGRTHTLHLTSKLLYIKILISDHPI